VLLFRFLNVDANDASKVWFAHSILNEHSGLGRKFQEPKLLLEGCACASALREVRTFEPFVGVASFFPKFS
jgi:hypothetical protein